MLVGNDNLAKECIKNPELFFQLVEGSNMYPMQHFCKKGLLEIVQNLAEHHHAPLNQHSGVKSIGTIHVAAQSGNLALVLYLMKKGLNVHETSKIKSTALHHAAKSGNLDLVKFLVEQQKLNIHTQTDKGASPLFFATNKQVAEYLIQQGADPMLKTKHGFNWILYALGCNNLELLDYCLSFFPPAINDPRSKVYLPRAIEKEVSLQVFQKLVDHGVPIDKSQHVLAQACRHNRLDIAKLLLEKNVDPNSKSTYANRTPVQEAACHSLELVKLLIDHGAVAIEASPSETQTIYIAASSGKVDIVLYLLDIGVLPPTTPQSKNLLHHACMSGDLNCIKTIHQRFMDMLVPTSNGASCLHYAAKKGTVEVLQYLIDAKCDPNATEERQPLYDAVSGQNEPAVHFLLQCGNKPVTESQHSPLDAALTTCTNTKILDLLIQYGAQVGSANLVAAIRAKNVVMAKHLVRIGVDIPASSILLRNTVKQAVVSGKSIDNKVLRFIFQSGIGVNMDFESLIAVPTMKWVQHIKEFKFQLAKPFYCYAANSSEIYSSLRARILLPCAKHAIFEYLVCTATAYGWMQLPEEYLIDHSNNEFIRLRWFARPFFLRGQVKSLSDIKFVWH